MGPSKEALALADFLIARYGLTADRYQLAYAIMEHEEKAMRAEPEQVGEVQGDGRAVLLQFGEEDLREGSRSNGHDGVDHDDWVDYIEVSVDVLNQIAAALASRQPVAQGNMFWLAHDGEQMGYSVEELIDDMSDGDEVEIQTAVQLPNFWIRVKVVEDIARFDVIDGRDAAPGVGDER